MASGSGGFDSPNSTQTPDAVFDCWLTRLTGGELRVLLFLIRRTYGWKREQDDVSISQFVDGITDGHGNRITEGSGVGRSTAISAVKKLLARGLIHKTENKDAIGADEPPTYRLHIRDRSGHEHPGPLSPINTTQVPDAIFDYWLAHLSDSELAVLLYIVRRTMGFGKPADIISPDQFLHGIMTRDGDVLDEGCGVSKGKLYPALTRLVECGLITIERRIHPKKGNLPSRFALVFAGPLPSAVRARDLRFASDPTRADELTPTSADASAGIRCILIKKEGPESGQRASRNRGKGVRQDDHAGSRNAAKGDQSRRQWSAQKLDPQETVDIQDTTLQETSFQKTHHQQHMPRPMDAPTTSQPVGGGVLYENADIIDVSPLAAVSVGQKAPGSVGERADGNAAAVPASGTMPTTESGSCMEDTAASVVILATEDTIRDYRLGDDDVLLDAGEERAQVTTLRALVCNDILATRDSYAPVWTDVYYSAAHFLGVGGDDWTPEEERKTARHSALRAELDALYKDVGAFSLEEALGQYFTEDLVRRYAGGDQRDRERVQGWLRYVRGDAAASLTNAAGFLRTRIESTQWAPRGASPASRHGSRRRL